MSLAGLPIDYFKFRLLPSQRRKKLLKMADEILKQKVELAQKLGPLTSLFGGKII